MAKDQKPERVYLTSPRGVYQWPRLNAPDTKFKEEGEYSVSLILKADAPETKKFIETLTPHYEAALEAGREEFKKLKVETRKKLKNITENALFTEVFDKETEEPTGEIKFRFTMTASGVSKKTGKAWKRKPKVFDAKGNYMPKPPEIWSGTEGRVNFELRPYFVPGTGACGLSLRLEAVKILKLVSEGGAADASKYGFDEEEDGYEYEADAMTSDESGDASDDDGEGDDDGSGDF